MPTKRRRRHQVLKTPLTEELLHVVLTGCYGQAGAFDFECFLLAGAVIRGRLESLRALWAEHGAAIKTEYPEETFAEVALRGDDWRARFGRCHCPDHPLRTP